MNKNITVQLRTLQSIIESNGGLEVTAQSYVRIENHPYMRLVIEVVAGPFAFGEYEVSVAHYGEQNGDPMRDPEMTFLVKPDGMPWEWLPLTFRNDYAGHQTMAATYEVGAADGLSNVAAVKGFRRRILELGDFARMWDKNLREQGFAGQLRSSVSTLAG